MSIANAVPNIEIPLSWKTVLAKEQHFPWHKKPRLNVRERDIISGPRVYRWVLTDKTHKTEAVYIGETEKFEVRLRSYCIANSKAPTETKRIRHELKHCEDEGGSVELQFLDLESGQFILNGTLIDRRSLAEHTARILLESIAVFVAKAEGYRVLNHSRKNVLKKVIMRLFKLSDDKVDAILQTLEKSP